jgi:AcrR family transcriptional regulator
LVEVKVSPRPYRLGQRAASVTQTRARILAATRELLCADGAQGVVMDEVAQRADVARATVYYQFGSKHGLLEAIVDEVQQRAGQQQIARAAELANPVQALRRTFLLGCRFWASEQLIVRRLTGLAAVDPEIRDVLASADQHRLVLVTRLVDRLADAGQLAAGCSRDRAIDVLWLLSSFEAFDQLFTGRRLPPREVATVLLDLARCVLAPPGPDRPGDAS